jgi:hypothetical protein
MAVISALWTMHFGVLIVLIGRCGETQATKWRFAEAAGGLPRPEAALVSVGIIAFQANPQESGKNTGPHVKEALPSGLAP